MFNICKYNTYAGNNQSQTVVHSEDIILLVDDKTTLHATMHMLKVNLEMKEFCTRDNDSKGKGLGDVL